MRHKLSMSHTSENKKGRCSVAEMLRWGRSTDWPLGPEMKLISQPSHQNWNPISISVLFLMRTENALYNKYVHEALPFIG